MSESLRPFDPRGTVLGDEVYARVGEAIIDALRLVKDALHEEAHVKLMVDDYGFQDICHAMQVYLEDGMVQLLGLEILAKSRLTLVDNTGTEKVNTGSTLELTA